MVLHMHAYVCTYICRYIRKCTIEDRNVTYYNSVDLIKYFTIA